MYYVITVLSIISILSLMHCWKQIKRTKELTTTITNLRLQLQEQGTEPEDKFQTFRQRLEHARKHLIPAKIWKTGMPIEEVAYLQGKVDTLDWLEVNHNRAQINMRHVRT